MLPSMTFNFLFLASAPMPILLAFHARRTGRTLIAIGNLALWGWMYLNLGSVLGTVGSGFLVGFPLRPGTALTLVGWLVLLRFAISGGSSPVEPGTSR